MKRTQLVLIIILGLILIGVASIFSYRLGQNQTESEFSAIPLLTLIKSKAFADRNITAIGEVKEISGRNLILVADGDSFSIPIAIDAKIEKGKQLPIEMKFEEIKVGDRVTIAVELKTDGTIEGNFVTIISK